MQPSLSAMQLFIFMRVCEQRDTTRRKRHGRSNNIRLVLQKVIMLIWNEKIEHALQALERIFTGASAPEV